MENVPVKPNAESPDAESLKRRPGRVAEFDTPIRRLRDSKGWSMIQAAVACQMSFGTWKRIERDPTDSHIRTLERVAAAFDLPLTIQIGEWVIHPSPESAYVPVAEEPNE